MVNRFNEFLRAHKIAKGHLITAEERLKRGDYPQRSIESLIHSVRELMVMTSNLGSMYFKSKPKKRRAPKLKKQPVA